LLGYLLLLKDDFVRKNFTSEWFPEFDRLRNEIKESSSNEEKAKMWNLPENSNITAVTVYLEVENTGRNSERRDYDNTTL
jgi:hypothetical protein